MAETTTRSLADLQRLTQTVATEPDLEPAAPKIDAQGRAYATGRRKSAVARVWVKPGAGRITVNDRDLQVYFARPALRMIINQPFAAANRVQQFDVVCTVTGGGPLGHPRVWIAIPSSDRADCPYCGRVFIFRKDAPAGDRIEQQAPPGVKAGDQTANVDPEPQG